MLKNNKYASAIFQTNVYVDKIVVCKKYEHYIPFILAFAPILFRQTTTDTLDLRLPSPVMTIS